MHAFVWALSIVDTALRFSMIFFWLKNVLYLLILEIGRSSVMFISTYVNFLNLERKNIPIIIILKIKYDIK